MSLSESLCQSLISRLREQFERFAESIPPESKNNPDFDALESSLNLALGAFDGFQTEYQRVKFLTRKGLIMPVPMKIGTRPNTNPDGSTSNVKVNAQYVSLVDTLTSYYLNKTAAKSSSPRKLAFYEDTSYFKQSDYYTKHPSALKLILYHDDIEVGNALGSRAGVHKLTMFYYSVHGFVTGKLNSIHLAAVCYAADIKTYGYVSVLKPIIDELHSLNEGVLVQDGDSSALLQARIEHIVGDNLAANQLLGMICSFSNGHFCRFCYISGAESKTATSARGQLVRSAVSHKLDIEMLRQNPEYYKSSGVKEACALNQLEYFSPFDSTVPDIM